MIEAEHLTRYYGDFPALQDASFHIEDRTIVGFLGLNGAGKSTLLRVLAGLQMPSAGRVRVGGIDATEDPERMRKRIGWLPEDPPLYREMRVVEFLRWVGQIKGSTAAEVEQALPRVLDACDLQDVPERVIADLSHGYRKRVGIAQAIVHNPDVVILDEPISGLDPQQIVHMRGVVQKLKEHATVLISSHILSEITQTCDRVLVIHRGKLVADGTEADLRGGGDVAHLELTLRGTAASIEKVLASHGLESFETNTRPDGFIHAAVGVPEPKREALIQALVQAGVGVRAVTESAGELEHIFLRLTQGASHTKEALS